MDEAPEMKAAPEAPRFRVWGLGFRVWSLGFGVWAVWAVWGLGFRVWGLGFRVRGGGTEPGFRVCC